MSIQPEVLYRFPITVQLREDTLIDVDPLSRLVARAAVDPPPEVEEVHDLLLNARERQELLDLLQSSCSRLLYASGDNRGDDDAGGRLVMPMSCLVEILSSITSTPLLPRAWSKCQPHIFAKVSLLTPVCAYACASLGLCTDWCCLVNVGTLYADWQPFPDTGRRCDGSRGCERVPRSTQ